MVTTEILVQNLDKSQNFGRNSQIYYPDPEFYLKIEIFAKKIRILWKKLIFALVCYIHFSVSLRYHAIKENI